MTEMESVYDSIDGKTTYDADLDIVNRDLKIDGTHIDLGLCIDHKGWFGGDLQKFTFRQGPHNLIVTVDRRAEKGTWYEIVVEENV